MNTKHYGLEDNRLKFLIGRDGMNGALDFAQRTKNIYRSATLRGLPDRFRRGYIQSYLAFKQFIKDNSQSGNTK